MPTEPVHRRRSPSVVDATIACAFNETETGALFLQNCIDRMHEQIFQLSRNFAPAADQ